MEEKKKELVLCFELQAPIHIVDEIVRDMLVTPDAQKYFTRWQNCVDDSHNSKSQIITLPMEDTVWNLHVITTKYLNHSCEKTIRTMALTESSPRRVTTIQISVVDTADLVYQEQARKLVCHGCLHPLGKTPRRPRLLSLKDTTEEVVFDCDDLGISLEESAASQDLSFACKSFTDSSTVRQCSVCSLQGNADLFQSCSKCQGVIYCSDRCHRHDVDGCHKSWCAIFKQCMEMEDALADLPFSFVSVTTSRTFTTNKKKRFLREHDVLGMGLWHTEGQDAIKSRDVRLLEDGRSTYGLEMEEFLLQQAGCCGPPDIKHPLRNWSDYYAFHGFPMTSIISALLSFSLTLYHIITSRLPTDFTDLFSSIQQAKVLTVHIIGVEKEAEMFEPFLECARLLRPLCLQIYLFGNELPEAHAGETKTKENLFFQIHRGLYHEIDHSSIPEPHLAVCFNGGLGAYSSYLPTLRLLTQKNVPFYYTDYGLASIAFSTAVVQKCQAGVVSQPKLNPFRSPFRITSLEQNIPRYSNAFITYIAPFSEESSTSTPRYDNSTILSLRQLSFS